MTAIAPQPGELGLNPQIYGPADFRDIKQMIHRMAGIDLPDHKATLVYSRLVPRLRATGTTDFGEYRKLLRTDRAERYSALCALTTNHTQFFRESHHLDHMRRHLRDPWLERLGAGGEVRIWSAGCSTGEEVWSILLSLMGPTASACADARRGRLRLLASDIDRNVLRTARAARYPVDALAGIPPELARHWTVRDGSEFTFSPELTDFAAFRMLNLIGEWPMRHRFDAIFCRNVMIYFDAPTKQRLLARLAAQLAPGGILYIGHSERITRDTLPDLMEIGPTIYRKEQAAA